MTPFLKDFCSKCRYIKYMFYKQDIFIEDWIISRYQNIEHFDMSMDVSNDFISVK